ncbi:hypothetical protein JYQ62_31330 [Nostoc sp. UHCC 0702]|nr:hypothetical protein JYQ62_31330 [Nostoc sp. UHCC 0702]
MREWEEMREWGEMREQVKNYYFLTSPSSSSSSSSPSSPSYKGQASKKRQ